MTEVLLAFAVAAVVLAAALVLVMTIARAVVGERRDGDGGPTCGRCRYSLLGAVDPVCPECGGDLRRVGIVVGGRRPATGRFAGLAFGWTALVGVAGAVSTVLLVAALPAQRWYRAVETLSVPGLPPCQLSA